MSIAAEASKTHVDFDYDYEEAVGPISVLIVDDEVEAAEELAEALEDNGFACFIATSSGQAHDMVRNHPEISAVVTDFYLRGSIPSLDNGLKLIEFLREAHPERMLDCVVVSGDRDVLAECTIQGAEKFLSKPIAPESLTSMLAAPRESAPAEDGAPVSMVLLHKLVESQSKAIESLTEALSTREKGQREALSRMDRLVLAARVAGQRSAAGRSDEIDTLIGYIEGQSVAVNKALSTPHQRQASSKPTPSQKG